MTVKNKRRPFTDQEREFLIKNASSMTLRELSIALNRSDSTLKRNLSLLGLRAATGKRQKKMSQDELDFIRENSGSMTRSEIARELGRTVSGVTQAAQRMGVDLTVHARREWSDSDIEELGELFDAGFSYDDVAEYFGATRDMIKSVSAKYGLTNDLSGVTRSCVPWDADDVRLLVRLHESNVHVTDIASRLGRAECSVHNKITALGLRRPETEVAAVE